MISLWRIVKEKHANSAFDGEGARRFGGRLNDEGFSAIYTSGSLALAALELLVHLEIAYVHFKLVFFEIIVPKKVLIEIIRTTRLAKLLKTKSTQEIGSNWLSAASSCILQAPSAIIPNENNYIINPLHKDFKHINIKPHKPFCLDERLAEKLN